MKINELIKKYRQSKGYKQEYVATLTGIPQSTISRIENGEKSPTYEEITRIFQVLGKNVQVVVT